MLCVFLRHGQTPIHMAASNGHVQVVQYLHEKGANINCVTIVSIHWCSTMCHHYVFHYTYTIIN